jgi:multicomponent Na+:H+ antiporter subunit B
MSNSLIIRTLMRFLLPLLLVLSLYLLLGSFEGLGGGFGSGLLASAAIILHMIVADSATPRRSVALSYITLAAAGLLLVTLWGSFSLLINRPFLTTRWIGELLPGTGNLGTPVFVNIGAYMVVIGVTTQIALLLQEAAAASNNQTPTSKAGEPASSTRAPTHSGQTRPSPLQHKNQKDHTL